MRIVFFIFLMIGVSITLSAQVETEEIEGTVTFLTAQNVYVKFLSAKRIKPGDKIFIRMNNEMIPLLVVDYSSSISCVGKLIGDQKIKEGDKVIAIVPMDKNEVKRVQNNKGIDLNPVSEEVKSRNVQDTTKSNSSRKQEVKGRLQFSSYSNFSNLAGSESHRLRYTMSLDVLNVGNSRLSFESYVSFTHKLNDWAPIKADIFNGLKIYDLNLKYQIGKGTTVWMGRKINPKVASLGAIDGVQFESAGKYFYCGVVAGLRPDYTDYGFNSKLPEYGVYLGQTLENKNGLMQTSVAVFEQTNSGNTDRRYAYFQHDNSLVKNINLFVSSEVDLYKVVNGLPVNGYTLTSLYASLNFRLSKRLSIMGSYDNRKNVIYYETFKSYVDQLLEDASRQGVQLRINYRPINYMNFGVSSSYRLRDKDILPTKNVNGYLSYAKMPFDITASLTGNIIQTSYVNGTIYGLRLDKSLMSGKLNWGLNYRYVDYQFVTNSNTLQQHIGEANLSVQVTRKFSLSVNYEGTFEKVNKYHSIYFSAIKRF
ncbi:MAG: hypothetical protein WCP85_21330 [Mariniphaga sp.]